MILAAALLVLVGLALFVAGILTGVTVLYWACVATCVVAGVLIIAVWRRMPGKKAVDGAPSGRAATKEQPPAADAASPPPPPEAAEPVAEPAPAATTTATAPETAPAADLADPGVEEVEVPDLLIVVDLTDEVLVVDEHPRYHLAECSWLGPRETIPLRLDEARTDGFTPCAVCSPDRTLAERARARK